MSRFSFLYFLTCSLSLPNSPLSTGVPLHPSTNMN